MVIETPLATRRLVLRPWKDADRQPFAEMSEDPEVMKYLMPFPSREASDAFIDYQQKHLEMEGFCFWAVELAETANFIGFVGLLRVGFDAHFTPAVEVGWRLARRFWGHGYAPEAAQAALRFGFEDRQLGEIVALTVPMNINSQRVMIKLGMSRNPADDFDHPRVPEGHSLRPHVLYRLSSNDWLVAR